MKETRYDYTKWLTGETRILILLGVSGAGKTTLSEKIQSENSDVKLVNFDVFIYDNPHKYKSCEVVDAFFVRYPEFLKLRNCIKCGEEAYFAYFKQCIDFIIQDYVLNDNCRVILEGTPFRKLELLNYVAYKYGKLPSLIILRISSFRATLRIVKRGLDRRPTLGLFERLKFFARVMRNNYVKNLSREWELSETHKSVRKQYTL